MRSQLLKVSALVLTSALVAPLAVSQEEAEADDDLAGRKPLGADRLPKQADHHHETRERGAEDQDRGRDREQREQQHDRDRRGRAGRAVGKRRGRRLDERQAPLPQHRAHTAAAPH